MFRQLEKSLDARLVQVKYNTDSAAYTVRPVEKAVVHKPARPDEDRLCAFESILYKTPEVGSLFMLDEKCETKLKRQLKDSKEVSTNFALTPQYR